MAAIDFFNRDPVVHGEAFFNGLLGAETMIDDEVVQNVGVAQMIDKMSSVDRDGN